MIDKYMYIHTHAHRRDAKSTGRIVEISHRMIITNVSHENGRSGARDNRRMLSFSNVFKNYREKEETQDEHRRRII